jgi:hypothetical protein
MMCQWASYKYKYENENLLESLKSVKKGVGSGFISQRYGSGDLDPHQNVTNPLALLVTQSHYTVGSRAEGRPGEPGPGDERPEG